jgi:hypothetical protein
MFTSGLTPPDVSRIKRGEGATGESEASGCDHETSVYANARTLLAASLMPTREPGPTTKR